MFLLIHFHYQPITEQMLIYNGCRISEFLDLKKGNVHLDEQYFDVIVSKTDNGIRKVPMPLITNLGLDHTPHDTSHTCISMLAEAHVDPTMIKKIVGYSGAMTLTEKVYTHLDIQALVEAINKI